MTSTFSG